MNTRKVWNLLLVAMLTFIAPLSFSSCSDDFNEKEVIASLVGRIPGGKWSSDFIEEGELTKRIHIEFYPDGYGEAQVFTISNSPEGQKTTMKKYEFNYSVDEDNLHIATTEGLVMKVRYSFVNGALILNFNGEDYLFVWTLLM